ncbi:site-specific DNA-methyltransferase [Peribacillus simplex]
MLVTITNEGKTLLDCFMGSGGTGQATKSEHYWFRIRQ